MPRWIGRIKNSLDLSHSGKARLRKSQIRLGSEAESYVHEQGKSQRSETDARIQEWGVRKGTRAGAKFWNQGSLQACQKPCSSYRTALFALIDLRLCLGKGLLSFSTAAIDWQPDLISRTHFQLECWLDFSCSNFPHKCIHDQFIHMV